MILALDIGGTRTRYGLFAGTPGSEPPIWRRACLTTYDYVRFLARLEKVRGLAPRKVDRVGLSFGVTYSVDGRVITAASKMPDFVGRHIVDDVEAMFGCKCRAAHDCVCALLAETDVAQLRGSVAYVTVSSGTGAAVLLRLGGRRFLLRVRVAHQIISRRGRVCHCGQRGCLASYTDGIEIAKRTGAEPRSIVKTKFWREFTDALAVGLVNLSWMYPVNTIVVGGGIALNSQYVRANLPERFIAKRSTGQQRSCHVTFAALGEQSPLLGACRLVCDDGATVVY